jgi:large subunit ribosomal protein L2
MYKAGKKFHAWRSTSKRYPRVRGVAMNPVDHPHGGGSHQHVGRPSTVSSRAPPGRKVGRLSSKKKDTKHHWRRR